jgi:hypothetical protein
MMRAAILLALCALLAACAGGPKARMFPPGASVQEIRVLADGQWAVAILLQNNARLGIRINALDATLSIDGIEAARLNPTIDIGVASSSVERLELVLRPSPAAAEAVARGLAEGRGVGYAIQGELSTSEPGRRRDPFSFASRLSPTPGLADTLR